MNLNNRLLSNVEAVLRWYRVERISQRLAEEWPDPRIIKAELIGCGQPSDNELFRLLVYYGQFQQMLDESVAKRILANVSWWTEKLVLARLRERVAIGADACDCLKSQGELHKCLRTATKTNGEFLPADDRPFCHNKNFCQECPLVECEKALNRSKTIGAMPVSFILCFRDENYSILEAIHSVDGASQSAEQIYQDAVFLLSRVSGIGEHIAGWFLRSICQGGTDPHLAAIRNGIGEAISEYALKVDTHVLCFLSRFAGSTDADAADLLRELACHFVQTPRYHDITAGALSQALYAFDKRFNDEAIESSKPTVRLEYDSNTTAER